MNVFMSSRVSSNEMCKKVLVVVVDAKVHYMCKSAKVLKILAMWRKCVKISAQHRIIESNQKDHGLEEGGKEPKGLSCLTPSSSCMLLQESCRRR